MSATKAKREKQLSHAEKDKIMAWLLSPEEKENILDISLEIVQEHSRIIQFIESSREQNECLLTSEEIPLLP